jgi:hypothetical protein
LGALEPGLRDHRPLERQLGEVRMPEVFGSFNSQLDDLLHRICENVQITKTQHERAESAYVTVSQWLADAPETSILYHSNPRLYTQGSLRLGTPVKPIGRNEFDADSVCEFQIDWTRINPQTLLVALYDRLKEHETYQHFLPVRLEPGRRCVTLTYKNEFHLDILPACPARLSDTGGHIKVADKIDHECWKDSNPKGFAKWFDERSNSYSLEFQDALRQAEIADFPDLEVYESKTPLQRTVQLLKRWRDIAFEKSETPKKTPISVVITTLAAGHYRGSSSINATVL